ncbi:aminopeptidase P family protein [Crenobacter sp. SG2303]|uniref:Aminopeptidase P family protein n=1 Tax=Crenobacter oryzisoli TaxID=3056844 RepID=A0ABT7XNM4_9NEIS|nr:aminopeptidase P family protein [Crenobacter sp. SG2303]MDN0075394.1 aminopeptidase P family protein [Crenobacter sp. SG2303]
MTVTHSPIPERLSRLRQAMQAHNVAACFIPSADPHLSEYLPARWQGRRWLSGFTGSVGNLIVTADFAGLWVDSRYWEQAAVELAGTGITMMKTTSAGSVVYIDWLAESLPAGAMLAVDGAVLALESSRALRTSLATAGVTLRTDLDLLDQVWAERAGLPGAPVYEHLPPYATVSRADKLAHVRQAMRSAEADWHLLSTLDDIAWLFNLRGSDVNYNPVFLAHALVGDAEATLFVAPGAVDAALAERLAGDGVRVADYADAAVALAALPAGSTLLIDPHRVTLGLVEAVPEAVTRIEAINPSTLAKAQKTGDEAAHIRVAMEQDGAALCEFFSWLEQAQAAGQRITELDIDEQITTARARQPGFVCPSFGTIAGFNANGAMPHYHATPASHAVIEGQGLLLIDSGGQYLCGTTDITRVVPVGEPNAEQKRDFTLVLKGMIQLTQAQFPAGTRSPMLDVLARAPIWAAGVDYGHGTGHGVGYFLNVHEGPQSIAILRSPDEHTAMLPGMVTSNEPGLYRLGQWGVRIENLLLNVPATSTGFGDFLKFETLTLCPIDTRCVDLALLREDERAWLNDYHAEVRRRLAPRVQGEALAWLTRRTEAI